MTPPSCWDSFQIICSAWVECCSDQQILKSIRRRIQSQMSSLDGSVGKVRCRARVLERVAGNLKLGGRKRS